MNEVYLLTGGNMGDRMGFLDRASMAIQQSCGVIARHSSVYETEAWGKEDQAPFLNQVLQINTTLQPRQLLEAILQIEEMTGRKREIKYGPRQIDIDILFFGNCIIHEQGLVIPHPQIQHRRFVLAPLAEIAPDKIHPVLGKTVSQLLAGCADQLAVYKFS